MSKRARAIAAKAVRQLKAGGMEEFDEDLVFEMRFKGNMSAVDVKKTFIQAMRKIRFKHGPVRVTSNRAGFAEVETDGDMLDLPLDSRGAFSRQFGGVRIDCW